MRVDTRTRTLPRADDDFKPSQDLDARMYGFPDAPTSNGVDEASERARILLRRSPDDVLWRRPIRGLPPTSRDDGEGMPLHDGC